MTQAGRSGTTPSAESVAQRFHEVYEALAPAFNYDTRPESRTAWADVPENNRSLMIATCDVLLDELGVERAD